MRNTQHPTFGNGKICYIEIPAIDVQASATFYQKVFNWSISKREDGSITFDDAVGEVSGTWVTYRKPSNQIAGFMMHIMVYDALSSIDLIVANGGKIIQGIRKDVPEITALFSDPGGNILGIYQHNID